MTQKDAMMFPIIASCALFGLYIFFHIFSKEYINLLLSFYFLVLGIFALSHMTSPLVLKLVPSAVPVIPFHLKFTQGEGDSKEAVLDYQFNTHDLVCLGLCSIVGVWYIMKKHWLANNLLGMAFAVNGNKRQQLLIPLILFSLKVLSSCTLTMLSLAASFSAASSFMTSSGCLALM